MEYYKPQSPIKKGEVGIYPLTTYDQVIMKDGSRFEGEIQKVKIPLLYYGVFKANSWVQNSSSYSQTVQLLTDEQDSNIDSSSQFYSLPMCKQTDDKNQNQQLQEILNLFYLGNSILNNNQVTVILFDEKPSIDITVYWLIK